MGSFGDNWHQSLILSLKFSKTGNGRIMRYLLLHALSSNSGPPTCAQHGIGIHNHLYVGAAILATTITCLLA